MQKVKIYPELISWRKNKQDLVQITIRIDFAGNRAGSEKLGHQIKKGYWDNEQKRVTNKCPNASLINQLLENKLNHHKNFFLKRELLHLPVNKELIKHYLKSGSSLESFYDFADVTIKTKKLKDGFQLSEDSKRRYQDEIKRMMLFKEMLQFHQLDVKFLEDYKLWLQTVYKKKDGNKLEKNSVWKALSFIRMIYNQAIKDEIILSENNPFKKFEVGGCERNIEKIKYLEIDHVSKIEALLENRSTFLEDLTQRIGWRFLAMCVTGLRISDAMLLDDMMFNDAGDLQFTPYKTRRHGNKAQIPVVSERQRKYLQRTISLPLPPTNAKSFRTTFNIHLKVIAAAAGIQSITSHAGRHTMGSLLVDAGIEDKAAMAMLGIKSNETIKTYMHLKESKLRSEAEKLKNIF